MELEVCAVPFVHLRCPNRVLVETSREDFAVAERKLFLVNPPFCLLVDDASVGAERKLC